MRAFIRRAREEGGHRVQDNSRISPTDDPTSVMLGIFSKTRVVTCEVVRQGMLVWMLKQVLATSVVPFVSYGV